MNFTLYENRALDHMRVVPTNHNRPTISLLIETSSAYGRGLLEGVQSYMRSHADWRTYIPELRLGKRPPKSLSGWRGDGVIACVDHPAVVKAIGSWDIPTVDVSPTGALDGCPSIVSDDRAIATMAFEHFYEQGFRHFGFYEAKGPTCSARGEHFAECVRQAGLTCHVHTSCGEHGRDKERQVVAAWLSELPKPAGVMACCDRLGIELIEACRSKQIKVPNDVAILGVGNDSLLCEMADPRLSSIVPDARRIGHLAADYLDQLLKGEVHFASKTNILPIGIVARKSTDAFAIDDPEVAAAARFIRNHATEGIKVADVLEAVPMSRRVLESRFRKWFGCTPHREILRVQLSHVRALIRETDLSLDRIAARCGFRHVEYMSVVFKRELGCTPSEYRQSVA